MEADYGSGILAGTGHLDRSDRLALRILLDVYLALSVHLCDQQVGKGVHAGHTHTVETSGNLVAVLVELTSGVKHRENDLKG